MQQYSYQGHKRRLIHIAQALQPRLCSTNTALEQLEPGGTVKSMGSKLNLTAYFHCHS